MQRVFGRAFPTNQSSVDYPELVATVSKINQIVESGGGPTGFNRGMYAPHDDEEVQAGERVFYTGENARRLDAYRPIDKAERSETKGFTAWITSLRSIDSREHRRRVQGLL